MMPTINATQKAISPKKAPDHFRSSHALEVGGGMMLASFSSSISNRAMTKAYAQ